MAIRGKIGKFVVFALYLLLITGVGAKLFFEKEFDSWSARLLNPPKPVVNSLNIGFSEPLVTMSPLSNDSASRARLLHIYEPLIRVNRDLQLEPGLARSYGSLNDLTWEFHLRPDIVFHNGTALTIDDVVNALAQAQTNSASQVRDLVSTIEEITPASERVLHITTRAPDPLLPAKLSSILIFPRSVSLQELAKNPVGTGPYSFVKNESGTILLEYFADYWGSRPAITSVTLSTFNKDEKNTALSSGSADILERIPVEAAESFNFPAFSLERTPSLEVNFLLFNFDGVFKDVEVRRSVASALDTESLSRRTRGFAVPISQFVGNGIFGFNPNMKAKVPDAGVKKQHAKVQLDLPKGFDVFGNEIKKQIATVGVTVEPQFYTPQQLRDRITNHESPFFFFGWKHDLGDALDFLTAVVHSPEGVYGHFNGGNYKNDEVDLLIEESSKTVDPKVRLAKMRRVMEIITQEDVIGVPLFSPEMLYAVKKNLNWHPRVDGYILAQEVKL